MDRVYFVAADIHGHFDEWMQELQFMGYDQEDPSHWIVVLGDLLDRGKQNYECLTFVNSFDRKILIRGNHEDLMESLLQREWISNTDVSNGTAHTLIECYMKRHPTYKTPEESIDIIRDFKEWDEWKKYVSSLIDFYEEGDNIFVHGWIPLTIDDSGRDLIVHSNWRDGDWKNARWLCGMRQWEANCYLQNKTIFCGHWHTSWGHSHLKGRCTEWGRDAIFTPFVETGIVAMDGCVAHSNIVNVAVIEKDGTITFNV